MRTRLHSGEQHKFPNKIYFTFVINENHSHMIKHQMIHSTAVIGLIFFFLCTHKNIIAQPAVQWQKTIGGSNEDNVYIIQKTNDGGYIMIGYSNSDSSGEKSQNSWSASNDYWVVKIDSTGIILWQNTIGGNGNEIGVCVRQTSDGGYIIGGSSDSGISGNKDSSSYGMMDYWIVKLDAGGQKQWEKVIGSNNDDLLYSVYQTNDGGYILGGRSNSGSNSIKGENSLGGFDYWVVKLDSTSNSIQWENTIGGSSDDYLLNLNLTTDGGYILAGKSNSPASSDKSENSIGDYDFWVVKLDNAGIVQWDNTVGGTQHDEFSCVQQTNDGGYILGGVSNSDSTGDKTENSKGDFDYWIVKLNVTGDTIQWQKTIGGNNTDGFQWLEQTNDSGYIVGGYSNSTISGDKTQDTIGGFDNWILKLTGSGNISWQKTFGGTSDDYLYYLQRTNDNGCVIASRSNSGIAGDKTDSCRGGSDYWILKLASGIHADIESNFYLSKNLKIFPNPSNGNFTIYFDDEAVLQHTIILRNILSQELFRDETKQVSFKIELGEKLNTGIYFLEVHDDNNGKVLLKKICISN